MKLSDCTNCTPLRFDQKSSLPTMHLRKDSDEFAENRLECLVCLETTQQVAHEACATGDPRVAHGSYG